MEGYNIIPQKLYVLRMNEHLNDVGIEEYSLAQFQKLQAWFANPQRHNQPFEEMKLIGQYLGAERIAHYSTTKFILEQEQNNMKLSLLHYKESVLKVEQVLKNKGYEDIRHVKSTEKLDLCSFSDSFYVYGKPFLTLEYRLGHLVRTDEFLTEFDRPCWKIEFFHQGGLSVYRKHELLHEQKSFDEWITLIVRNPKNIVSEKTKIKELIHNIFDIDILVNDILYDSASECYLLKEKAEQQILKDIIPQTAVGINEIAKYTTLETLVAILQSGTLRMNSIVSMNDKTETDFLQEYIKNYKEDFVDEYDKYLFADKEFITSFTTRIDDLDMWRLYGDNAHGVCLVFERDNKDKGGLYEISYVNADLDILNEIAKLQNALKDNNIRFRLNLLQKYQHFMKHSDYSSEKECRLLVHSEKPDGWFVNRDNGILTPFIVKNIARDEKTGSDKYPFRLSRIILGPASREKMANFMQIFYMSARYGYYLAVEISKINSYR